jgi:multimeric flavodoxin WrbA
MISDAIAECLEDESDIILVYKKATDTLFEDILQADGIIICSPEYFGYMCGAIKDFFDRTYYLARAVELNKPYALIVCCENDGTGTERSIDTIARGYILKKALDTLIIKEKNIASQLSDARELGIGFATGIKLGIF